MNYQIIVLAISLITALSGCTNKQFYNATQPKNNEAECRKLHPTEYDKCISRGSKSYEEYEKERQDILKN
jgi:hypothetical protein